MPEGTPGMPNKPNPSLGEILVGSELPDIDVMSNCTEGDKRPSAPNKIDQN